MGAEGLVASVPPERLRRFLHDVSAPLSAVALHLESASRRAEKGEDPSQALEAARKDLRRAFEIFERGRQELLADGDRRQPGSRT